jgi:hypothetical protein
MFAVRLSIAALTLIFLVLALATRELGMLDAIVIICPLLYLILDMREELHSLKFLEERVSAFSDN